MDERKNESAWWAVRTNKDVIPADKATQRNPLSVALAFLVLLLVLSFAFWGMTAISPNPSRPSIYGSTERLTSITAVLNKCGNIFDFPVDERYIGTFEPADITPDQKGNRTQPLLPTIIQPYGFMREEGLDADKPFYSPKDSELVDIGTVLRSMYDGKIILWYRSTLLAEDISFIRQYAWDNKDKVVAIARKGAFPEGRNLAFATWGATMSCGAWQEDVVDEFVEFVDENRSRLIPNEPPPSANIKDGKFPSIVLNPFE